MSGQRQGFETPRTTEEQAAVTWSPAPGPPATPIDEAVERARPRLMTIEGVIGVAHGRTAIGDDAIVVYVMDPGARERVPKEIEGYPVEVVFVPGGFHAQ